MSNYSLPTSVISNPALMRSFYENTAGMVLEQYIAWETSAIDTNSDTALIFRVLRRSARTFVPYIDALYKHVCEPFLSGLSRNGQPCRLPSLKGTEATVKFYLSLDGPQQAYYYTLDRVTGLKVEYGETIID